MKSVRATDQMSICVDCSNLLSKYKRIKRKDAILTMDDLVIKQVEDMALYNKLNGEYVPSYIHVGSKSVAPWNNCSMCGKRFPANYQEKRCGDCQRKVDQYRSLLYRRDKRLAKKPSKRLIELEDFFRECKMSGREVPARYVEEFTTGPRTYE